MNKLLFELASLLQISYLLFSSLQIIGLAACNLFFQISVTLLIFGSNQILPMLRPPFRSPPSSCTAWATIPGAPPLHLSAPPVHGLADPSLVARHPSQRFVVHMYIGLR
ncbi:hypothetical protein PVAP13_5KG311500 [Panicum virgatum]|uniref:Uncharacterized protein n=1 Tax=Panicum virgatum TaxID=38727 RepID=A0A8T0SI79_PANVG|nr:hypothetical protein PVAP13_5KG311500 [Panicum virgatum]